ncbi:hypothetical protein [Aeromonas phage AerS_266]|nr:hypothetical protein [Aeromonas phage AerS_266]
MYFRDEYKASTKQLLDAREELISQSTVRFKSLCKRNAPAHSPTKIYGLELTVMLKASTEEKFVGWISVANTHSVEFFVDKDCVENFDSTVIIDQLILKICKYIVSDSFWKGEEFSLSEKIKYILEFGDWGDLQKEIYPQVCVIRTLTGFSYHIQSLNGVVLRSGNNTDNRSTFPIPQMQIKENSPEGAQRETEHSDKRTGAFYFTQNGIFSNINTQVNVIHDYLIEDLTLLHLAGDFNQDLKSTAVVLYKR